MNKPHSFWFYVFILSAMVIAFAYYAGLTADASVVGPFVISLAELAQGRNPATGEFSNYPSATAGPPAHH